MARRTRMSTPLIDHAFNLTRFLRQLLPDQQATLDQLEQAIHALPQGQERPVLPLNATPSRYCTNWLEILVALGLRNTETNRRRIRRLNKAYDGPILFPGPGSQPKASHAKLIDWWNGLEV